MTRPGFFEHLHPPTIAAREARFGYTFGLGGIAVFLFFVLVVTGVPLMFVYVPTTAGAAASIRMITFVAPYGWLLRNAHYWAGQLLVVVATLHLLRVALTGAYKGPRRFNWLLGLCLFSVVLLLNFTGYVLRWDADTNWALTVGVNLVRETPIVGPWLYGILVGAAASGSMASALPGEAAVGRFYTWHVIGLAIPAAGLVAWHVFRVRRDGGISRRRPAEGEPRAERIQRQELLRREGLAMLAVTGLLLLVSLFFDAPLGAAVDPLAGNEVAQAPWFFLWVQALLRSLSPLLAGVGIPLLVLATLALLPWLLDKSDIAVAEWFNRPGRWAQVVVLSLLAAILSLTLWEMLR